MDAPELIIVGRLRKAHGIRGALVVQPITDAPAEVFAAGRRLFAGTVDGEPDPDRGELTVASARPLPDGSLLVRFAGIDDRTASERWRGRYLLAATDTLRPPAAGEVYVHELAGMHVERPTGESLGTVRDVLELPQGLALEVAHGGGTTLLPFVDAFVQRVDRDARRIVATPPDGLFE